MSIKETINFHDAYYFDDHLLSVKFPHYIGIYERHFTEFRGKKVNVLEIGIGHGGFLEVLKNYFGENSNVYGFDAQIANAAQANGCTKLIEGYQEDTEALARIKFEIPNLDIVIDDGSHAPLAQLATFRGLYHHLAAPGLYIVEDTQLSYAPQYGGYKKPGTFIEFVKDKIDDINAWVAEPNDPQVSDFTKSTFAIHVYANLVIFEKRQFNLSSPVWVGRKP